MRIRGHISSWSLQVYRFKRQAQASWAQAEAAVEEEAQEPRDEAREAPGQGNDETMEEEPSEPSPRVDGRPLPSAVTELRAALKARLQALRSFEDEAELREQLGQEEDEVPEAEEKDEVRHPAPCGRNAAGHAHYAWDGRCFFINRCVSGLPSL
ncbi:unnamed protein product [Effrenium voratum]|nr:unnamed protein product [Effrenium voratum]